MRRPTERDDYVIRAAALALAEELLEDEIGEDRARSTDEQPDLITGLPSVDPPLSPKLQEKLDRYAADLVKVWCGYLDGYALARLLEAHGCGWHPDAEMVEALDSAQGCLDVALRRALRDWVKLTSEVLVFTVGDHVILDALHAVKGHHVDVPAIVRDVKPDVAQYGVRPAAGHPATDGMHDAKSYYVVDSERVRRPFCFACGWPNPDGICAPNEADA